MLLFKDFQPQVKYVGSMLITEWKERQEETRLQNKLHSKQTQKHKKELNFPYTITEWRRKQCHYNCINDQLKFPLEIMVGLIIQSGY